MALARDHDGLDTRLTIVGDGPERLQLEALANILGLANHLTIVHYSDEGAETDIERSALRPAISTEGSTSVLDATRGFGACQPSRRPRRTGRGGVHSPRRPVRGFADLSFDSVRSVSEIDRAGTLSGAWSWVGASTHHRP